MSQSRAVMLAAVLGIFLLIIVFSQEAGHVIDDRQADSLGEATTKASRTFGSDHETANSHESGTESSGRRLSRPPKPKPRFTFNPNRENVDTVFNPKEEQQQPLPDFRLSSDKPDAAFARIKDHFEVRSHDGSGRRRRGAVGGGGDEDGALRFFPLPMRVTYVRQLHHGIYECRGRIPSSSPSSVPVAEAGGAAAALDPAEQELVFAFKTECRPESKWHGQQGYPEILTNWAVETMFGAQFIGSFTPGAVGGLIRIASSLVDKIHRDGCGFLSEEQISALYDRQRSDNGNSKRSGDKTTLHPPLESGERVLVGAVLQWMPRHSDDAIPGGSVLEPFRARRTDLRQPNSPIALPHLPLSASTSARRTPLSLASVLQISDIFSLDYVLGNEDRLDKNWFKDAQQRFIAMDNGWALAGFNYDGSACDLDEGNLRCPPLFRKLVAGKQLCGGKAVGGAAAAVTDEEVYNCRFRRSTVQSVRRLIQVLEAGAAASDDGRLRGKDDSRSLVGLFRRDPLLAFLATFYNTVEMRNTVKNNKGNKKKRPWSNALARYVVGCPHQDSSAASASAAKSLSVPALAAMVNAGLLMRAKRLVMHVDNCVVQFGDTTVLF